MVKSIRFLGVLIFLGWRLGAQSLPEFEKKVTEFALPNGLRFVVLERHDTPVIAFHTYVQAGSANDAVGRTGLAHLLERMAFKGTDTIGTKDWANEKKALDAADEIYERIAVEESKSVTPDAVRLSSLDTQAHIASERERAYGLPTEFNNILEANGALNMSSGARWDGSETSYSLPSNRLELWFSMESQRLMHPVFRDFYKERDAMLEEMRQQVDLNVRGKVAQEYLAAEFETSPYHTPMTGWPGDVARLRRAWAKEFFEQYYVPGNMVMALVGDVNPAEAKRLAEKYFGPMPSKPVPPTVRTKEPPQAGPKLVLLTGFTQVLLAVGYKRPDQYDPDDATMDVLQLVLSNGKSSWLYRDLIQQKQLAVGAQAIATFPAGRLDSSFLFLMSPAPGRTADQLAQGLDTLLARLTTERLDGATLKRAQLQGKANAMTRLASNAGAAATLAIYQANYGDWKRLFTDLDSLNKVTASDVLRVSRRIFTPANRTTAMSPGAVLVRQGR